MTSSSGDQNVALLSFHSVAARSSATPVPAAALPGAHWPVYATRLRRSVHAIAQELLQRRRREMPEVVPVSGRPWGPRRSRGEFAGDAFSCRTHEARWWRRASQAAAGDERWIISSAEQPSACRDDSNVRAPDASAPLHMSLADRVFARIKQRSAPLPSDDRSSGGSPIGAEASAMAIASPAAQFLLQMLEPAPGEAARGAGGEERQSEGEGEGRMVWAKKRERQHGTYWTRALERSPPSPEPADATTALQLVLMLHSGVRLRTPSLCAALYSR